MATPERVIIEKMFRIADKDGNDVPFELNTAQASIDQNLTGRDIIPKARQEGVSSYFLARFAAICLTRRNARCVVISHDTLSTQRMLEKVHYFMRNIQGPPPVLGSSSKGEIAFKKTNSVFYIGTAGSRAFGRGDTITHLHCSEYAYWPDPAKLLAGLFQAVPKSGEIAIESTGNGVGNDYHKRCMRAAEGRSRFMLHFLPWHTFPEYTYDVTPEVAQATMENLIEEYDEPELVEHFGLDAGRLLWRRDKLEEMDYDFPLFQQEYPFTLDECFQASGHSIFHKVNFVETSDWKREAPGLHILEGHPNASCTYVIGADPSGGTGHDDAAAEVFCLDTGEQVAEYTSDRIAPDTFAHKLASLGRRFNNALLSVESNNHGLVTIKELIGGVNAPEIYPRSLIYRAFKSGKKKTPDESIVQQGVTTSTRSRPLMIGSLRKALVDDLLIHSETLRGQLSTFIETETGKLEAEAGCKDDCVMAAALASIAFTRATIRSLAKPTPIQRSDDPLLIDNVIDELRGRGNKLPISAQNGFDLI